VFNRSKNQPATDANDAAKQQAEAVSSGAKGRATPSRKEREAANRRPLVPADRKAARSVDRERLRTEREKQQAGLAAGDERYLPARDRGPVRRFIRDWVDCRFTVGEVLLPVLIVAMLLGYVGNRQLALFGTVLTLLLVVIAAVNIVLMRFRLRAEIRRRFPDASLQGTTYYATVRMVQVRFLRMPKPQVKIGQELPATYR